jgi:hypothetical protein
MIHHSTPAWCRALLAFRLQQQRQLALTNKQPSDGIMIMPPSGNWKLLFKVPSATSADLDDDETSLRRSSQVQTVIEFNETFAIQIFSNCANSFITSTCNFSLQLQRDMHFSEQLQLV